MKKIGTKIYYCLTSGNVIKIVGDCQGYVRETTFDEDYEIYSELKERNKSTIGLLQLEFGEYTKLSEGSTGARVNLETKELEFNYEELPQEPQGASEIEMIQEKISILEAENKTLKQELSITQDAINELIFNSLNI